MLVSAGRHAHHHDTDVPPSGAPRRSHPPPLGHHRSTRLSSLCGTAAPGQLSASHTQQCVHANATFPHFFSHLFFRRRSVSWHCGHKRCLRRNVYLLHLLRLVLCPGGGQSSSHVLEKNAYCSVWGCFWPYVLRSIVRPLDAGSGLVTHVLHLSSLSTSAVRVTLRLNLE